MAWAIPDSYFAMVKSFPLVPIKSVAQFKKAVSILDDLTARDVDEGEEAYLDVLADLVASYEDAREPPNEARGGDALKELIRANRLSQHELSARVGIMQSTISALVNGGRSFTVEHAKTLGRYFGVSPSAFLDL